MDIFVSALDHQELLLQANYAVQTTWLRRVARNKLVDYYRRQKRHPVVPLDEHIDDLFYDGPEPEQSALRHEEYTWLRTHLKDLSEPQQEILGLRFAAGLRCVEIAHLLKKRDGTVRMLLARALNALRVRYEQQWEEQ
ncbi:hypothetical protein KSD_14530 [Ktedonobacter sp. SOSP1-85]|nr:hypothetical protein KSC_059510 [Ktedonobacter sp. SOSP1-52]GHO73682.1 hypothetical protein KSD_14530 [Ktedonobacter sp. SOSP1-85]